MILVKRLKIKVTTRSYMVKKAEPYASIVCRQVLSSSVIDKYVKNYMYVRTYVLDCMVIVGMKTVVGCKFHFELLVNCT